MSYFPDAPTGTEKRPAQPARNRGCVIAAAVLGIVSMALVLVALLARRNDDKPGPQEQIGLRWLKPAGTEAAYAGSAACKSCHPSEFRDHSNSPHSHTLKAIVNGDERP